MSASTSRLGALLLAALGLSLTARAQSASPAWVSARPVGAGSYSQGATAVDAAGNTYEAGSFQTPTFTIDGVTLTSQGGNSDAYLAKYSPTGTLLWLRPPGSTGTDTALDVALDAGGGVYVCGIVGGPLALGSGVSLDGTVSRAFVARYSTQGTAQWARQTNEFSSGSGLGTDAAGHVYLAGSFSRTVTLGTSTLTTPGNNFGVLLARFAAATGELQALTLPYYYAPSTGTTSYNLPRLAVGPTGATYLLNSFMQPVVAGGTTLTSRGGSDVLVARCSALGALEWAQQVGGAGTDFAYAGAVDAAGSLYATGLFNGPATFGTTTLPGAGDTDGFLLRYSPAGALQWVQTLGGPGSDGLGSVRLDASGSPYVVGNYSAGARLGTLALPTAGSRDLVVAAYSPLGQLRWSQTAGGPGFDSASYLGLDAAGDVYVLGRFESGCVVGPFPLTTATGSGSEAFVGRLGSAALAARPARALALGFYPNPATDLVRLPALAPGTRVQLVDAQGRLVREAAVSAAATVSVRGLAAGLYGLRATDAQGQPYAGRVVVE